MLVERKVIVKIQLNVNILMIILSMTFLPLVRIYKTNSYITEDNAISI